MSETNEKSNIVFIESNLGVSFTVKPSTYTLPPYIVTKALIQAFGSLQDVPGDGNCFFTSYWRARRNNLGHMGIFDINIYRKNIFDYATLEWQNILAKVYSSRDSLIFCQYTRQGFNMEDIALRATGDTLALQRVRVFKAWYREKVLFPIWCIDKDFRTGADITQYGRVHYTHYCNRLKGEFEKKI